MPPPNPQRERGASGSRHPQIASSNERHQRYSPGVETQAAFFVLLPIVVLVALLAVMGARQ
jgi:hypothetical protein